MCITVHMNICAPCVYHAHRGQKTASDPLKPKTELGSWAEIVSAVSHLAIYSIFNI